MTGYRVWLVCLLHLGAIAALCVSCERHAPGDGQPREVTKCFGEGGGYTEWGQTRNGMYGVTLEPEILRTWRWENASLRTVDQQVPGKCMDYALLADDLCLVNCDPDPPNDYNPWTLVLRDMRTDAILQQWPPPEDWSVDNTGASQSGQFAAISLGEVPGEDYKIGVLNVSRREMRWIQMPDVHSYYSVRQLAVSDDGAHVAVGGWNNGVAMIDVSGETVRWAKRPQSAISMVYVAFAPDARTIYAGGGEGRVYGLDVQTGDVKSRWFATKSGNRVYGHRISCLAVSPDGRYVAAGTGPEGQAFVWDTTADDRPRMFNHGMTTLWVVSFSPDSRYLATFAGGWIKTWDLER